MERPKHVPPNEEWFWTPEWQEGEREVDKHLATARLSTYDDVEEFLAHLDSVLPDTAEWVRRPRPQVKD